MIGWNNEVDGVRARGRPENTWSEVVEKDCQSQQIWKEDAIGRIKWRKLIKDVAKNTRCEQVNVFLVPAHLGRRG